MEKNLKCAHCDGFYKKGTATRIFLNKYIKEDVSILKCDKCGHELVPLDEVENVYQEIRRIEKANILIDFLRILHQELRWLEVEVVLLCYDLFSCPKCKSPYWDVPRKKELKVQ